MILIFSVAIFVAVFVYMDLGALTPSALFVFASVLTFIGYILFDALDGATLRLQSGRTSRWHLSCAEGEIVTVQTVEHLLSTNVLW